jgi:hypothetical protein
LQEITNITFNQKILAIFLHKQKSLQEKKKSRHLPQTFVEIPFPAGAGGR